MRAASMEPTSPQHPTPVSGAQMATPLRNVGQVPWHEIKDSRGPATAIPLLLNSIAWGDTTTARTAISELRERICQYGFVVEQATAATVPFLWELARLPHVTCRVEIVRLLKNIADARQWEKTAAAYPKLLHRRDDYVGWEREARQAVRANRGTIQRLLIEPDTELVRVTTELASALTD
ncbi:hypothetical protein [Streptomyces sp. NPDC002172]